MKIQFERPLKVKLEVIEVNDRFPSMLVQVQIMMVQFESTTQYEGTVWIEYEEWDRFTQSLRGPFEEAAILKDLSKAFIIKIQKIDERLTFTWSLVDVSVIANQEVKIAYTSDIDDDIVSKIRNEFLEFPAWW